MIDKLAIAVVQSPYGLKGDCKLQSLSGEWKHIYALKGQSVSLCKGEKQLVKTIESIRELEPHVLVRFAGVNTPEDARLLAGMDIMVDRESANPLRLNEFYIADIQGCGVFCKGEHAGTIKSVWDSGAHTMLEVIMDDERVVHVPFMSMYVGDVDTEARRVEIVADWILE